MSDQNYKRYQGIQANTNITQAGRVVVNANLDLEELGHRRTCELKPTSKTKRLYENAPIDDKYMHIVPGEPLLMYIKRASVGGVKKRKIIKDTDLVVFSSLNGILCKHNDDHEDLENFVTFVGFADIQTLFNSEGHTRVDAVAQVGGLRTTVNTGNSYISAGDIIYWSLPSEEQARGKGKIVATLNPVRTHDPFNAQRLQKLLEEGFGADEQDETADPTDSQALAVYVDAIRRRLDESPELLNSNAFWADTMSALCKHVFEPEYKKIKSRVVGRALTSAKPGQHFDIIIGSYSI